MQEGLVESRPKSSRPNKGVPELFPLARVQARSTATRTIAAVDQPVQHALPVETVLHRSGSIQSPLTFIGERTDGTLERPSRSKHRVGTSGLEIKAKALLCGKRRILEAKELSGRTKQFNSKRNDQRVRYVASLRNQNRSVPISSEYPTTIRVDNNAPPTQKAAGSSPGAPSMLCWLRMSSRFISSPKKFYGSR